MSSYQALKGTTRTPAGILKRLRPNCHTAAGPTAETTPPLCVAQKPWGGHPSCSRPADYLPSGTVGQWPPATGQWWNERRGGDLITDQVTQGADSHNTRAGNPKRTRPNCHSKEVLSNQRGWHQYIEREGAQGPQWSKGQEPWRRGATGFCRLSWQLLARGGQLAGEDRPVFVCSRHRCTRGHLSAASHSLTFGLPLR